MYHFRSTFRRLSFFFQVKESLYSRLIIAASALAFPFHASAIVEEFIDSRCSIGAGQATASIVTKDRDTQLEGKLYLSIFDSYGHIRQRHTLKIQQPFKKLSITKVTTIDTFSTAVRCETELVAEQLDLDPDFSKIHTVRRAKVTNTEHFPEVSTRHVVIPAPTVRHVETHYIHRVPETTTVTTTTSRMGQGAGSAMISTSRMHSGTRHVVSSTSHRPNKKVVKKVVTHSPHGKVVSKTVQKGPRRPRSSVKVVTKEVGRRSL